MNIQNRQKPIQYKIPQTHIKNRRQNTIENIKNEPPIEHYLCDIIYRYLWRNHV